MSLQRLALGLVDALLQHGQLLFAVVCARFKVYLIVFVLLSTFLVLTFCRLLFFLRFIIFPSECCHEISLITCSSLLFFHTGGSIKVGLPDLVAHLSVFFCAGRVLAIVEIDHLFSASTTERILQVVAHKLVLAPSVVVKEIPAFHLACIQNLLVLRVDHDTTILSETGLHIFAVKRLKVQLYGNLLSEKVVTLCHENIGDDESKGDDDRAEVAVAPQCIPFSIHCWYTKIFFLDLSACKVCGR